MHGAVAMLALAAGCVVYDETVHVRLRDPALVDVAVATPGGEQPLIRANAEGSAVVPATEPPYREEGQAGATVARGNVGVLAHCEWCAWHRDDVVVAADGTVELVGSPDVLRRAGDHVRMRFAYVAPLPCHKGGGLCERPAFDLELAAPRDNILSIDYEKRVAKAHGELIGAKIGLGTGILFAAMGLAFIGYYDIAGEAPNHSAKLAVLGVGGAFTLVGGMFTYIGASTLRARDSDVPVAVP